MRRSQLYITNHDVIIADIATPLMLTSGPNHTQIHTPTAHNLRPASLKPRSNHSTSSFSTYPVLVVSYNYFLIPTERTQFCLVRKHLTFPPFMLSLA
jgi:hypothetical protein